MKRINIIGELILKYDIPSVIKFSLLIALLLIAFIYVLIPNWFNYIKLLVLIPLQKFQWQSEKYNENSVFRLSSFFSSIFIFSIAIFSYLPDLKWLENYSKTTNFFIIYGCIIGLFILKLIIDYLYFYLHKAKKTMHLAIDYQYGLNQLFAMIIGSITLIDVFFFGLTSDVYLLAKAVLSIYLFLRFIGTTIILTNNFGYPIVTVIVYLCTFEIAPIVVLMKLLFDNI